MGEMFGGQSAPREFYPIGVETCSLDLGQLVQEQMVYHAQFWLTNINAGLLKKVYKGKQERL